MRITPGHCNGIPGHYIRRLRCWEVTGWNRGCLARKWVMNPYETTFMQRRVCTTLVDQFMFLISNINLLTQEYNSYSYVVVKPWWY